MEDRFGRVKSSVAPEILSLLEKRASPTQSAVASYYCQTLIHRAHVVMLAEQGILTKQEAASILKGILEVAEEAKGNARLVTYMATEAALIQKIGEVGGKMHIGRSRNDLGHTQQRMYYRDQIERVIGEVINYRKALLRKAEETLDAVMPGYTHWRQAQPITLGHYLVAHADAAARTIERLEDAYKRTNLNPLGSAALAGTGWPVDRRRTAELLGFSDLCENTIDAVASHDYVVEVASALAIHMSDLSRLAEDLQMWSSEDFQLVDLDEAYAGTSSIMPQKKNPSSLEMVKRFAAESIGVLVAAVTSVKGTSYTNIQDREGIEPVMFDTVAGCTSIMAGVVSTLIPLKENMLLKARKGFSTMTEVADMLVRSFGLTFRQAHDLIAEVTLKSISEGKAADQILPEMVEEAALTCLGKKLVISEESLKAATDPVENVKRRRNLGGPAPDEVGRMIMDRWKKINAEESRHIKRLEALETAYNALAEAEKRIFS
ncbi:MAG: argininosuccinate lyase [Candidatus Bathyarchaeia archaeon]